MRLMHSRDAESEFSASSKKLMPRVQDLLLPQTQPVLPGIFYCCWFLHSKGKATDLPSHLEPPRISLGDIQPRLQKEPWLRRPLSWRGGLWAPLII